MRRKDIEIKDGDAEEESPATEEQQCCEEKETEKETEGADDRGNGSDDSRNEEPEETPLAKAEQEIALLKDKYLRSVAEFDNYRKRTLKEKSELIINGSERAVQAVLPVVDDMERAIAGAANTDDVEVLKEGMTLIHQKFMKVLEGLGVKKIDTADADFDVDYHEAIAMIPAPADDKKGKVLDCVQAGYMLNDKVIRHAKVAVGQ